MDIVMPIMSGIDATQKILNQFPQIKVIACTTIDQERFGRHWMLDVATLSQNPLLLKPL